MNTPAVLIGLTYGLLSVVICYVVSMTTSGLFARPFYRLYGRVLIGTCAIMMFAPALRWLASSADPVLATIMLTLSQYTVMGIVGFGIYRFNTDFMKQLFLERNAAAYFTFGTLANAAIVTLIFLHVAVTAAPTWKESASGYITVANYGPVLMLLAGMLLHTDDSLKRSRQTPRRYTQFTFIGYAVSFIGLAISILPHLKYLLNLSIESSLDNEFLRNVITAQTLLFAIFLYGWLVWRYESIPPLFLLLLATIAQYYIVAGQWISSWLGTGSWCLAMLPMYVCLTASSVYFSNWSLRKDKSKTSGADSPTERFSMPFQAVEAGMSIILLGSTLWIRLQPDSQSMWTTITFVAYAIVFTINALVRKSPALIYATGLLVGLAAVFGFNTIGSPSTTLTIAGLAMAAATIVLVGKRFRVKQDWLSPIADCGLGYTAITIIIAINQYEITLSPDLLQTVFHPAAIALLIVASCCFISAYFYRSQLLVYVAMALVGIIAPTYIAVVGLIATLGNLTFARQASAENKRETEDRFRLFNRFSFPLTDALPKLYSHPVATASTLFALIGLILSIWNLFEANLTTPVLIGIAASAATLCILTYSQRSTSIYAIGLISTHLAIHCIVHATLLTQSTPEQAFATHLLVLSILLLTTWSLASIFEAWCSAMVKRVAEKSEAEIRFLRNFYCGPAFHLTTASAIVLLCLIANHFAFSDTTSLPLIAVGAVVSLLLALSGAKYQTQVGTYLALAAITLTALMIRDRYNLPIWNGIAIVAAITSAVSSLLLFTRKQAKYGMLHGETKEWFPQLPWLKSNGVGLWMTPLCIYALLATAIAIGDVLAVNVTQTFPIQLNESTPLILALASSVWLAMTLVHSKRTVYIVGLSLALGSVNTAAVLNFDSTFTYTQLVAANTLYSAIFTTIAVAALSVLALASSQTRLLRANFSKQSLAFIRGYYGGLLCHWTAAVATIALVALILIDFRSANDIVESRQIAFCGAFLATTFAALAVFYRSRLFTYFLLVTALTSLIAFANLLSPDAWRTDVNSILFAGVATTLSVICSLSIWIRGSRGQQSTSRLTARPIFWRVCPLPMYSPDSNLWTKPTSYVSSLLALYTLGSVVSSWIANEDVTLNIGIQIVQILLSSIALFLNSINLQSAALWHGVFQDAEGVENTQSIFLQFEKGLLFLLSIVSAFMAIHLVSYHVLTYGFNPVDRIGGHLLLTAVMAISCWLAANGLHLSSVAVALSSDLQSLMRSINRLFYGKLLHHFALVASIAVTACVCIATFYYTDFSSLLPVAMLVTTVHFGVSASTYRSQLPSYLSILTFGAASVYVFSEQSIQIYFKISSSFFAVISLSTLLAYFALRLVRGRITETEFSSSSSSVKLVQFRLPSPWANSPIPMAVDTPFAAWFYPLRALAAFFASVSFVTLTYLTDPFGMTRNEGLQTFVAYTLISFTFVLLTRLYGLSSITYASIAIASIGSVSLLSTFQISIQSLTLLWALSSLGLWLISSVDLHSRMLRTSVPNGRNNAWFGDLFARPCGQSSTILAIIAIVSCIHSLTTTSRLGSSATILATFAIAGIGLMLNAYSFFRNGNKTIARVMVYIACLSLACSGLIVSLFSEVQSVDFAVNAAVLALLLLAIAVGIIESVRHFRASAEDLAAILLEFAKPISHIAGLFAFGSVALLCESIINGFLLRQLDSGSMGYIAIALLFLSLTSAINIRVHRWIGWVYGFTIASSIAVMVAIASVTEWPVGSVILAATFVMHLFLLFGGYLSRREVATGLINGVSNLDRPFQFVTASFSGIVVTTQVILLVLCSTVGIDATSTAIFGVTQVQDWPWLALFFSNVLLVLHTLYRRPIRLYVHLLVIITIVGFIGMGVASGNIVTPDVSLAILGFFLSLAAATICDSRVNAWFLTLRVSGEQNQSPITAGLLSFWAFAVFCCTLIITLPLTVISSPPLPNTVIVFGLASLASIITAVRWKNIRLTVVAAVLCPLTIVSLFAFVGQQRLLISYGAPFAASLASLYLFFSWLVVFRSSGSDLVDYKSLVSKAFEKMSVLVSFTIPILAIVSFIVTERWLFGNIGMCIASTIWICISLRSQLERYAYAAIVGFVFASFASFTDPVLRSIVGDSTIAFLIIGFSLLLFGINTLVVQSTRSAILILDRPTYYTALAIPVALTAVLPSVDRASAAFALIATGAFYLMAARPNNSRWAYYTSAALFNVAVYLWIPTAIGYTGLLQLYVIPAAITVLIFAQLHRDELKPSVLSSIRFCATACMLAVSTSEALISKDASLLMFAIVLSLSLAGVAIGISLRIKAFMFTGLAFLVFNVIGQVGLQIHREGGIIRALILISVGIVILSLMILFNIHRERILKQYRGFLSNQEWD